jgi:sirohydrochlorin cobaltochelatase
MPERASDLVVAVYGTTGQTSAIDLCVEAIRNAVDPVAVHTSLISPIIRERLARRGVATEAPADTLSRLADSGCRRVVVQPLLLLAGSEFHRLAGKMALLRPRFHSLRLAPPLLGRAEAFHALCDVLQGLASQPTVFVGHGSEHAADAAYGCLQSMLDDRNAAAYIGSLGGYPDIASVARRVKRDGHAKVVLRPLMLAAGRHAVRDIGADDGASWRNRLRAQGILANPLLRGLAEEGPIQRFFVDRAIRVLEEDQDSLGP